MLRAAQLTATGVFKRCVSPIVQRHACLGIYPIRSLSSSRMAPPTVASSQNVTLPVIPELYNPDFLDVLLPADSATTIEQKVENVVYNPMMEALKASAQGSRTLTDNLDPAYSATGSPTLDAFRSLKPHHYDSDLKRILAKAWEEDPQLTLRLIWNSRSIHDGKNDRDVFYQLRLYQPLIYLR